MRIEFNKIYNMDCLDGMKYIKDKTIDMILSDLPYGRTKNKWDKIIPFKPLWEQYERIIKDNGCIALFADGMFMADLMCSNKKLWRYNIVWDKVLTSGFLNANKQPLRSHEEICIFYKKPPVYHPQKTVGSRNHSKGEPKLQTNQTYGEYGFADNADMLGNMKFPTSIWHYPKPSAAVSRITAQKPLDLLRDLILTYTDKKAT